MRIHNLYEDADGESNFRDVEVDWVEETPSGKIAIDDPRRFPRSRERRGAFWLDAAEHSSGELS
jgi:hypothetical protein